MYVADMIAMLQKFKPDAEVNMGIYKDGEITDLYMIGQPDIGFDDGDQIFIILAEDINQKIM